VYGQGSEQSSWGVVGTFVPAWEVTPTFEPVATLHFSEDEIAIEDQNLKGAEFRIGIARGRATGGDWGVSFVRRTFEDIDTRGVSGGGCSGGGTTAIILQCEDLETALARRDTRLNGIEAHKFVPFVTIARRVQVGINLAGGIGFMTGQVDIANFRTTYTCTFPPGVFPEFVGPDSPCTGATISNQTTVQTGSSSDDIGRLLKSDSTMLPIGRAEIGAAVIVAPQFKVRIAGGLNYPGTNMVSITGIVFFGAG
jgi:hypothetical protein